MFTRLVTVILLIALISQVVVAGPVHPEYADYFDDTMKACCAECKASFLSCWDLCTNYPPAKPYCMSECIDRREPCAHACYVYKCPFV
ncbi:hypothetical protein GPALN_010298 [Globodera pallida]|nr:hypothetical protein GPALN_010298 [Globodera pallida]